MIFCASSQLKRLAALWTGPSMNTNAPALPWRVPTSSNATVAPQECPTTIGFSSPVAAITKSTSFSSSSIA
jgi:hypothetical protein